MNRRRTFHLLNGQAMYDFYKRTGFLDGEMITPFNEAMCFGDTCGDILSREFIELRAKVHGVSVEQYLDITIKPLSALFRLDFTDLSLWFDTDMFCQINVLTILAWLDQTNYKGTIELCIVGDQFELKERYDLTADGYHAIYHEVLIQKKLPRIFLLHL